MKDRTGVSYREAKSALKKLMDSVADAIILIGGEYGDRYPATKICTGNEPRLS